jgi:PEP-CTERM motif
MKAATFCRLAFAVCLFQGGAWASTFYIYNSPADGQTVLPDTGASSYDGALATSWIFGEVSVDPSYVGDPIWGQTLYFTNPTPDPIDVGVITAIWAPDGADGGPGTLLSSNGQTASLDFAGTNNGIIVYSNFTIPAGNFWIGYSFQTVGSSPATTASALNDLAFDLSSSPTVGASASEALLGSQVGPLGNNPTIVGPAGGYLHQAIQMYTADVPEPSSIALFSVGVLLFLGVKFHRNRTSCV